MKRLRLSGLAAVAWAVTGLLSGCMSCDPCRPGLMARLTSRMRATPVAVQGPMAGPFVGGPAMPEPFVSGPFVGDSGFLAPNGSGCCDGPALPPSAMPGESLYGGPVLSPGYNGHPAFNGHLGDSYGGPMLPPSNGFGAPVWMPSNAQPGNGPPVPYGYNGAPPVVNAIPGRPLNGRPLLPAPEPSNPPRLAPVPNNGFATPTPAPPAPPTSLRK